MTKIIKSRHEQISKASEYTGEFLLEVAKGNVPGHSFVSKFGSNPDMDSSGVGVPIWDYGNYYSFPTAATIDTISSSATADVQNMVVQGLDENWEYVTQAVTLSGQTKVTLGTPLIRCFRAFNANSVDLAGNVYVYCDDTASTGIPEAASSVKAVVRAGINQTEMCIYTVPKGRTGFFLNGFIGQGIKGGARCNFTWKQRSFGGVFRVAGRVGTGEDGSMHFNYKYAIPIPMPEKTDIMMVCEETTGNNTLVYGVFELLLVDNDFIQVSGG